MARLLAAPATSRKVPKLEVGDTPVMLAVPVRVRLPLAKGVPAVGRTRTFCQVREQVTPEALLLVTVNVNWLAVTEVIATEAPLETPLILPEEPPEPVIRVIFTVGAVPPVSNTNPAGALRMMVPLPPLRLAFSVQVGPIKLVNVPPTVSAEMALPPVAATCCAAATVMAGL